MSRDDLTDYWVLMTIGFVCSFIPLFFLHLIPTRKQIETLQASLNAKEEEEKSDVGNKEVDGTIIKNNTFDQ